jgi:L-lactate dehydrogenase complex protein LldF
MKPEALGMKAVAAVFRSRRRLEAAHRLARVGQAPLVRKGWIHRLPGELAAWTAVRDLQAIPRQSFREWWKETHRDAN